MSDVAGAVGAAQSLSPVILAGAAFVGLAIGSFLNVVIHRVPLGLSILAPGSACPTCGHAVRPVDNIPVLSWLILRGRCRDCGARISARYVLVELGTAVFFVVVVLAWQLKYSLADFSSGREIASAALVLAAYLVFGAATVALAVIDVAVRRLPNPIVLAAAVMAVCLFGASALALGDPSRFLRALLGGAALLLLYLVVHAIQPRGMGFGDVKLAGVIGLHLGFIGWGPLVVGSFGAFLFGAVFGLLLVVVRRATRSSSIPFGPWMLAGAWLGILCGEQLFDRYLALVGVS